MHQGEMLPRKFPKFGGILINLTTKFGRVELDIQVHKPRFGNQRNVLVFEDTLVRCLGGIIPFDGLVANPFFGNQFERGLKEVDVEPQIVINAFKDGKFLWGFPAIIANRVSYNGPILLLQAVAI